MDSLIKKSRVRFSGVGPEIIEETGNIKEVGISPQQTQSLKKEKKKPEKWFWRQFSGQMNEDDSNNGGEYPTAVAAAAFAIYSLEESGVPEKKTKSEDPQTSLSKIKSKTQYTTPNVQEPGSVSGQFSGNASMTKVEVPDKKVPIAAATNEKMPLRPAPSMKKTPTFADEHLNKPESAVPKPDLPSAKHSASPPTKARRQSSTKPGIGETKADAWERAQMAKIKERYDKSILKISKWEDKKKAKAKRQKDKREGKLEKGIAKAWQNYRNEMERIDQIAGGKRAQAEENRRNKEFKVKEKANKIRSTGKVPATCFCF